MTMIKSLRQWICKIFCGNKIQYTFLRLHFRTGHHIRRLLQKQYPDAHIRIRDAMYGLPWKPAFNRWLQKDMISERQYHAEHHDCDDFAHAIQCKIFKIGHTMKTTITVAYCEGHTSEGYHAFNLLIDDNNNIFIIEPQIDMVIAADESTYRPDFIQL